VGPFGRARATPQARNTLIYAVKGVEIEHASDVRAFNTPDRHISSGRVDNTAIEPLFQK